VLDARTADDEANADRSGDILEQLERVTERFRLNGMETSWLLDPSIPLTDVFREYISSLARLLALPSGTP
jgi:hypothetical protein